MILQTNINGNSRNSYWDRVVGWVMWGVEESEGQRRKDQVGGGSGLIKGHSLTYPTSRSTVLLHCYKSKEVYDSY